MWWIFAASELMAKENGRGNGRGQSGRGRGGSGSRHFMEAHLRPGIVGENCERGGSTQKNRALIKVGDNGNTKAKPLACVT